MSFLKFYISTYIILCSILLFSFGLMGFYKFRLTQITIIILIFHLLFKYCNMTSENPFKWLQYLWQPWKCPKCSQSSHQACFFFLLKAVKSKFLQGTLVNLVGTRSFLVGCHLWGCTESETTEVTQQQQQQQEELPWWLRW